MHAHGVPAGLAARAVACYSVRDFVPLYAVYALLFADHGLSSAAIASLFAIWSAVAFVAELPSGAWADVASRRLLLVLSGGLYAVGFALWMLVPSYGGFAAGFAIWGFSGALMSGTFEALLYDELAQRDAAEHYARVMGWAESGSVLAQLAGTVLAAPLFALGGYTLVGWSSVGVALAHAGLALSLPGAPRVAEVEPTPDEVASGAPRRYLGMLRAGVAETTRVVVVRRGVLLTALLMGLLATDEFAPLVAREGGIATGRVPYAMGIVLVGYAVGTALGGRTWRIPGRRLGVLVGFAAACLAAGALADGWLGMAALAGGFGLGSNAMVVADARLQHAIAGWARATVTSMSGLLSELCAVAIFAIAAVAASGMSVAWLVAGLALPLLALAVVTPRWLPPGPGPDQG